MCRFVRESFPGPQLFSMIFVLLWVMLINCALQLSLSSQVGVILSDDWGEIDKQDPSTTKHVIKILTLIRWTERIYDDRLREKSQGVVGLYPVQLITGNAWWFTFEFTTNT